MRRRITPSANPPYESFGICICRTYNSDLMQDMRVTIITGGGSGIGAAVARRLAGRDQRLTLHGHGADEASYARLKAVAAECERAGAKVAFGTGDLAKPGTAAELVRATRAAFGPIDTIVHAAGFADRRSFAKLQREALDR